MHGSRLLVWVALALTALVTGGATARVGALLGERAPLATLALVSLLVVASVIAGSRRRTATPYW